MTGDSWVAEVGGKGPRPPLPNFLHRGLVIRSPPLNDAAFMLTTSDVASSGQIGRSQSQQTRIRTYIDCRLRVRPPARSIMAITGHQTRSVPVPAGLTDRTSPAPRRRPNVLKF